MSEASREVKYLRVLPSSCLCCCCYPAIRSLFDFFHNAMVDAVGVCACLRVMGQQNMPSRFGTKSYSSTKICAHRAGRRRHGQALDSVEFKLNRLVRSITREWNRTDRQLLLSVARAHKCEPKRHATRLSPLHEQGHYNLLVSIQSWCAQHYIIAPSPGRKTTGSQMGISNYYCVRSKFMSYCTGNNNSSNPGAVESEIEMYWPIFVGSPKCS